MAVPQDEPQLQAALAIGTDGANGHYPEHETVQSGANRRESVSPKPAASKNNSPRLKAGLCGSVQDSAGKRVNGFERVDIHVGNVQAHRPHGINRVDFLR